METDHTTEQIAAAVQTSICELLDNDERSLAEYGKAAWPAASVRSRQRRLEKLRGMRPDVPLATPNAEDLAGMIRASGELAVAEALHRAVMRRTAAGS